MTFSSSRKWIAAFAVVLTATTAFGQDTRARIEGIVKEGSKPVAGVLAVANNYESVWSMKTNTQGEFSFYLPPGCYDVLLSSPLFHPKVKRLCIDSRGGVKKLSVKLSREASPRLPLS